MESNGRDFPSTSLPLFLIIIFVYFFVFKKWDLPHDIFCGVGSDTESSAYMFDMAFAKYAFAWGRLIWINNNKVKQAGSERQYMDAQAGQWRKNGWLTLNVGVRRPFSTVNGSGTKVRAFANSKPFNCKEFK